MNKHLQKFYVTNFVLLSNLIFSASCMAVEAACDNNILNVITDDGPPHMIKAENSGIDLDITRQVLSEMCFNIKVSYAPLRRTKQQVIDKKQDLFLPTFLEQDTDKLFYSDPIISYKPTLFTLTDNNISLNSLADIQHFNVTSFQGAKGYFGEKYAQYLNLSTYREMSDMSRFPTMLVMGRTQVIVLDYYIFYYYLAKYHPYYDTSQITAYDLIPSVSAHVGFNNRELREQFNQVLSQVAARGDIDKIIEKYIGEVVN